MPELLLAKLDDHAVLRARRERNLVSAERPYAFMVEPERTAGGAVESVATIFLTNRECRYRCVMCDLWKNTLPGTTPPGAIPRQIEYALGRLAPAAHVKLYNSGNFFDAGSIPLEDHAAIAEQVQRFRTVIVENHPRMCGPACVRFRDRLKGDLEIALGLETADPKILARLNKGMTPRDFERAVAMLRRERIAVRTFILVHPPFAPAGAGLDGVVRSMQFAFDAGVDCCSLVPTRAGNGIMDALQQQGLFVPPALVDVERALERGLALRRGRVFLDLWDIERLAICSRCGPRRVERLQRMNLTQQIESPAACECEGGP